MWIGILKNEVKSFIVGKKVWRKKWPIWKLIENFWQIEEGARE